MSCLNPFSWNWRPIELSTRYGSSTFPCAYVTGANPIRLGLYRSFRLCLFNSAMEVRGGHVAFIVCPAKPERFDMLQNPFLLRHIDIRSAQTALAAIPVEYPGSHDTAYGSALGHTRDLSLLDWVRHASIFASAAPRMNRCSSSCLTASAMAFRCCSYLGSA